MLSNKQTSGSLLRRQQWFVVLLLSVVAACGIWGGNTLVSASFGVASCLVPVLLSLRLFMRFCEGKGRIGLAGVALVELAKVVLTILALLSAGKFLHSPNWLAVVAGFVLGQVLSWLALWLAHVSVSKS